MLIRTVGAVALLLLGAGAPARGPIGHYRLSGGPDTASEIVLMPDERFQFFLIDGALDQHAEGRWTVEGNRLRLETLPKPVPPAFSAAAAAKTADGPLELHVRSADGHGIALIDLRVGFDTGGPVEGYTQEYGWTLPAEETRTPRCVELGLQMYGVGYTRFPVDPAKANALTYVLTELRAQVDDVTIRGSGRSPSTWTTMVIEDGSDVTTTACRGREWGSMGRCLAVRPIVGPFGFAWLQITGAAPLPPPLGPGELAWPFVPVSRAQCFSGTPLAKLAPTK